ncbi:hypothetical protein [Sulfolobus tengchongensis spindle-shaped virus 3]|nr:hypothetical protein [Sulfolobus tengchongensis spindle-shaped virus 3]
MDGNSNIQDNNYNYSKQNHKQDNIKDIHIFPLLICNFIAFAPNLYFASMTESMKRFSGIPSGYRNGKNGMC